MQVKYLKKSGAQLSARAFVVGFATIPPRVPAQDFPKWGLRISPEATQKQGPLKEDSLWS